MSGQCHFQGKAKHLPHISAGNSQQEKPLRRMFQDPAGSPIPLANFDSELVQGQPNRLAQEFQMLSLYTNLMIRLRNEEKGATAVEYGIMVGLIAVVIIAVVVILGPQLAAMFQGVSDQLPAAPTTAPTTP